MNVISFFFRIMIPAAGALLLTLALVIVARSQPDRSLQPPANPPPSATAEMKATGFLAAAGIVEPASEAIQIGSTASGVVTEVAVKVGQKVQAGAVLFRIDDRETQAEIAQLDAALKVARQITARDQVALDDARAQLAFYDQVGDPRSVAADQVSSRQFAVRSAEAQLAVAKASALEAAARLEQAKVRLALHQINAPINGVVLQINLRPGEFAPTVGNLKPLMIFGAIDPLHIRVDIDENELPRLKTGGAATISPRGAADQRIQAAFVRIEPYVVPKTNLTGATNEQVDTRVLQVIYSVPATAPLYIGQQVDAFLEQDTARANLAAQP
jgi:HlyD family secretion protein